jgi:Tfp pilus assembly protein PilP
MPLPAAAEETLIYRSIGRRDPFRGLTRVESPAPPTGALAQWSVDELRLVGVAERDGDRFALIEPAQGPAMLARVGSVVAKEGAVVAAIARDRVVLRSERWLLGEEALVVESVLAMPEAPGTGEPEPAPGP